MPPPPAKAPPKFTPTLKPIFCLLGRGDEEFCGGPVDAGFQNSNAGISQFPKGPNLEKIQERLKFSISLENFNLAWNFQSWLQNSPQKIGVWWVASLKFSRSWNFFKIWALRVWSCPDFVLFCLGFSRICRDFPRSDFFTPRQRTNVELQAGGAVKKASAGQELSTSSLCYQCKA